MGAILALGRPERHKPHAVKPSLPKPPAWREDPAAVRPMLATLSDRPPDEDLVNDRLVYEPKYDGIRALVAVEPGHPSPTVRVWSRNGHDKTEQFPELVRELKVFGKRLRGPVLLDGEVVALDAHGEPTGFGRIQPRLHTRNARDIAKLSDTQPVAFIAFDVLRDGADDLRGLPLSARRMRLEKVFGNEATALVRQGTLVAGDGRRLYQIATDRQWEGLVAKDAESRYESGRRSPAWRKLKLTKRQEFVVGGWTEPRQARLHFGALLLGVYDPSGGEHERARTPQGFRFVGQVGSGFTDAELARVWHRLQPLATDTCPFTHHIDARARSQWTRAEPAHWAQPALVAEVKYSEWTEDGVLRHPVYIGLREDVDPLTVGREGRAVVAAEKVGSRAATASLSTAVATPPTTGVTTPPTTGVAPVPTTTVAPSATTAVAPSPATADATSPTTAGATSLSVRRGSRGSTAPAKTRTAARGARVAAAPKVSAAERRRLDHVVAQLEALEAARRDGVVDLGGGQALDVSNLAKVFWPQQAWTKGDLLRYYTRVSPWMLPAIADRPLVMKRFPDGVSGKAFYQHRPPDHLPTSVRVALVKERSSADESTKPMFVGGDLYTLLYMTQLASISQDPWFSRVETQSTPDYIALDLDPMAGVPFARVLDVARWIRDELEAMGVPGVPKTSGSSGLHIYIALPPETPYDVGQLFGRLVATVVATKHPDVATVERAVGGRGRTVYVDFLQNIQGKTLASAYSARANEFGGVSTPLLWSELDEAFEPHDFTLANVLERFDRVGDIWARLRTSPPLDLYAALDRLAATLS